MMHDKPVQRDVTQEEIDPADLLNYRSPPIRPPAQAPIRVLHFYRTSFPDSLGGIEQTISQLAKATHRMGVETSVLSLTRHHAPATMEMDGYLLHRSRLDLEVASTGFSFSAFSRFAQLAKQVDVVHYHFPWPFMDLVHFATRAGKPTLVTYHSDIIRQKYLLKLYSPLMMKFLGSMEQIVATSPNYLATSDVLAKYKKKVRVIPIGLDKASYPQASTERLRHWEVRLGRKFFLFVGVLRYYKGLHLLLEAAKGTDYPIAIVGAGPVENELKALAGTLKLRHVHFLGMVPEVDKVALLQLCYCVVFPSHLRSEAFGISLLEGAMFGKPMISSEIGTGTTYINIHGETGLVIPPSNSLALRNAMRHLWEHPSEAQMMGVHAERRYWKYFTARHMAQSYVELYKGLIARSYS